MTKRERALEAVAARLKAGDLYEDCLDDVDALLGTGLEERDRAAEADWEANYEELRHDLPRGDVEDWKKPSRRGKTR